MIVEKSRLLLEEGEARIVATVRSEAGNFTPFDVFIGVPSDYVGWLDLTGNPFVPTFLLLANMLGETLRLRGTVSPLLLHNAHNASALFQSWWGMAPAAIEADASDVTQPAGAGCALFFTRGVDSWHSALRDRTGEKRGKVSHLLYTPAFDRQYSAATRRRALALTREAADQLGLPLIKISHNGRDLLDRFINWERVFGGVLAGISLALGVWFSDTFRASCIDRDHLIPWGSHPDLDPLWSTERTTSHLDGVDVSRTDKVREIARSHVALERIKVCWRDDIDTNCGQCDKCVRTQLALAIAGALERAPVFLVPLTPRTVMSLPPIEATTPPSGQEVLWSEVCESFPDDPRLAALRFAACQRLPARHPLSTASANPRTPAITVEAPAGAATGLLPASARDLLGVPVTEPGTRADTRAEAAGATIPHVEITWTTPAPGRLPLPLRPPASISLEILDACRATLERPNPWCLIAVDSRETAALMTRLTESWGQGITCLTRNRPLEGDHGIPHDEAALIQQCSATRVWWGDGAYLDPFLVLEALRHGCLPLQCVPESSHDALAASLPPGLSRFTLAVPATGPVPVISQQERAERFDHGLSTVLAGNLERDLSLIIPCLKCELP
jgi:hypothetical protein